MPTPRSHAMARWIMAGLLLTLTCTAGLRLLPQSWKVTLENWVDFALFATRDDEWNDDPAPIDLAEKELSPVGPDDDEPPEAVVDRRRHDRADSSRIKPAAFDEEQEGKLLAANNEGDDAALATPPERPQSILERHGARLNASDRSASRDSEKKAKQKTEKKADKEADKKRSAEENASSPKVARRDARAPLPLLDLKEIDALAEKGDYIAAQREYSRWFWRAPADRDRLMPRLNKLAHALYFARDPHYYEPYVVKPGDQLRVVGQRQKLSWEFLAKINRVDPVRIRMGQKLKVVPGPFGAVVNIGRHELVVHLAESFVKRYRVGVGKDGATPIGVFTVKNKLVDPTYYGPEGVLAHDDPENPLGERWIDIGDGYGIHGTVDESSIGRNESRGCIRMLNSDVEEVYDFLVLGSPVKIEQ